MKIRELEEDLVFECSYCLKLAILVFTCLL